MDLLVDRIVQVDAKHSQNDDGYFVFEEMVTDIMLLWSRDEWIKEMTISKQCDLLYPLDLVESSEGGSPKNNFHQFHFYVQGN